MDETEEVPVHSQQVSATTSRPTGSCNTCISDLRLADDIIRTVSLVLSVYLLARDTCVRDIPERPALRDDARLYDSIRPVAVCCGVLSCRRAVQLCSLVPISRCRPRYRSRVWSPSRSQERYRLIYKTKVLPELEGYTQCARDTALVPLVVCG